jgi:hypothetical protein
MPVTMHATPVRRRVVALACALSAALAAAVGGCAADSDGGGSAPPDGPFRVVHADYLPGLRADLHLPGGVRAAPVVLLVPGGAWHTADPAARVDALVGLAGAYDVGRLPDLAGPLIGGPPAADPAAWE